MKGSQGFIIFCVGIVLAIVGASKAPVEGSEWPDTIWLFIDGTTVALIGLVLWRQRVQKLANELAQATESESDPFVLLEALISPLDALKGDIEELAPDALTARIDTLLNDFVLPFAEVRQVLVNRLGMEKGAEVLVIVAFGERLLNRVWTAAADGHLPEAKACFPEAHEAFIEAQALIADVASA